MVDRTWKQVLEGLLEGQDLTAETADWVMDQILSGEATPAQTAGFLVALRAKGETRADISGLVAGMLKHAAKIDVPGPVVDTCGTGGDGSHSVNISSMSAVVAAAAGARVVKHGNRAASSKSGSAEVLQTLGISLALSPEQARACVEEAGITFLFAPVFHPAMRFAAPARGELGIRTVFNMLGPLANPASPAAQVVGVPNMKIGALMAGVLADRGTRALVVLGHGGVDELTADGPATVWDATAGDGSVVETVLDPADLGLKVPEKGALDGDDPTFNARVFRALVGGGVADGHEIPSEVGQDHGDSRGDSTADFGGGAGIDPVKLAAVRDVVALNAAAALLVFDAANGEPSTGSLAQRISDRLPRAFDAIDSGAAGKTLDAWVDATARLAEGQ